MYVLGCLFTRKGLGLGLRHYLDTGDNQNELTLALTLVENTPYPRLHSVLVPTLIAQGLQPKRWHEGLYPFYQVYTKRLYFKTTLAVRAVVQTSIIT